MLILQLHYSAAASAKNAAACLLLHGWSLQVQLEEMAIGVQDDVVVWCGSDC